MKFWTRSLVTFGLLWSMSLVADGQETPPTAAPTPAVDSATPEPATPDPAARTASAPPAAAIVNGEAITVREIEAAFNIVAQQRAMNAQEAMQTKAKLLDSYVENRLVSQLLDRDESLVTDAEVEKQIALLRQQAEKKGSTLEQLLAAQQLTLDTLRSTFRFQIGWNRYLERNLTDAVEGYFNQHKSEFDGTELRVSHILLRPDRFNETPAQVEARAAKIREEITSGKLSFAEAAKRYSLGPSRDTGGDLGFIPRHKVMLEEFAKAAYATKKGEISPPVTSAFGTHLITVTDAKPGNKQWTEVIPQIRARASQDLLTQRANEVRKSSRIEYTGKVPYFKPGTTNVIMVDEPTTVEPTEAPAAAAPAEAAPAEPATMP